MGGKQAKITNMYGQCI